MSQHIIAMSQLVIVRSQLVIARKSCVSQIDVAIPPLRSEIMETVVYVNVRCNTVSFESIS